MRNYLVKALLKRKVFRSFLKTLKSSMALSRGGKEFHNSGPKTLKDRAAKVFFLVLGTLSRGLGSEANRVALVKDFSCRMLESVEGAWSCKHLNTIQAILKSMRSTIGSQWSSLSANMASSYLLRLRTTLAAQFCTLWSGLMVVAGRPQRILFE